VRGTSNFKDQNPNIKETSSPKAQGGRELELGVSLVLGTCLELL
jgi:hypothetical protein